MKILILNGSPREKGVTAGILHCLEGYLIEHGAQVSFFDLGSMNIAHCRGCCSCYKTGRCYIKDDAEYIVSEILSADGVILGSPTYASNVSGIMKDMIDRGHFVIEQALKGKYCITVATGENYGNTTTSKVLNDLVLFSGGILSSKLTVTVPFNTKALPAVYDKKCRKSAEKLLQNISDNKKPLLQTAIHRVIFNLGIKPFVKKKGSSYAGVIEKWRR